MKIGEAKLRITSSVMNLIDTYFNENTINEKFINSTLKIILKQNIHKIEPFLQLFTDKNGEINAHEIISEYSKIIGEEGYSFDLKDYVENEMVKSFIPDKILLIKREHILNLLQ